MSKDGKIAHHFVLLSLFFKELCYSRGWVGEAEWILWDVIFIWTFLEKLRFSDTFALDKPLGRKSCKVTFTLPFFSQLINIISNVKALLCWFFQAALGDADCYGCFSYRPYNHLKGWCYKVKLFACIWTEMNCSVCPAHLFASLLVQWPNQHTVPNQWPHRVAYTCETSFITFANVLFLDFHFLRGDYKAGL